VSPGITLARARPDGTALSNAGLVDLGGSTLVFDTGLTLRAARDLRAAARALTGRSPSLSANSHWHLDHILGNQVFDDRPIHATRRTAEILLEKRAELEAEVRPDRLRADIEQFESELRAATSPRGRAPYEAVLRIHRALLAEAAELRITLPTTLFEGELRLPGERDARLLTFGSGHTESDAMLFLARDRVLFAGDLVVTGTHPNLVSGDPVHWLEVLDEIDRLRPERVATGHGPLGTLESVAEVRDYLTTLLELAGEPGDPPIPSRFRHWTEPDQFRTNLASVRARPRVA